MICRIPVGSRHAAAAILNCSPLSSDFVHVGPAIFSDLNELTGAMLPSEFESEGFEVRVGRPLPSGGAVPNQTVSQVFTYKNLGELYVITVYQAFHGTCISFSGWILIAEPHEWL